MLCTDCQHEGSVYQLSRTVHRPVHL
jgi:hypothetical protein